MANTKSSPNKFITALFGGAARRREQRAANEDLGNQMDAWEDTKMKNPYAGVKNPYANMENVYEDQTVDLKQAEFEKEQSQQSMANIMQSMQGAAGGSGIAGLAQVLANQGVKQAQQASASIGQQEQANQARARGEAGRLQKLDVEGWWNNLTLINKIKCWKCRWLEKVRRIKQLTKQTPLLISLLAVRLQL